jgi:hypothetical protein
MTISRGLTLTTFIRKLTVFLQLQEFSLHKQIVATSTSTARFSLNTSKTGLP